MRPVRDCRLWPPLAAVGEPRRGLTTGEPLVPIARVVKLDDDGAVAIPLADPSTTSFAIVEPPFEPSAIAAETSTNPAEAP